MLDENCAHALREAREKAERECFARNQVAFPDPKGAEGVARDLDVRFLGGLVIHELETALLQHQLQLRFRRGIDHRPAEMPFADLYRADSARGLLIGRLPKPTPS